MPQENTVFISYRRTNIFIARAVYQDLRANGYDCFLDYQSIDSGSFERVILNQVAARAHFVVILTPSAVERCVNPGDWVRREIEHAMDLKRNIVPLLFEDFEFRDAAPYLTGKLSGLGGYNGVRVPADYFEEAMARLRSRFLSKPIEVVLHPTPPGDLQAVAEAKSAEDRHDAPTRLQLDAESFYERGVQHMGDHAYHDAETAFGEAIERYPDYSEAYSLRGQVRRALGHFEGALNDLQKATELDPHNADYLYHLGVVYHLSGQLLNAREAYHKAIQRDPTHVGALLGRGDLRASDGETAKARKDYEAAMELAPDYHQPRLKLTALKRRGRTARKYLSAAGLGNNKQHRATDATDRAMLRSVYDYAGRIADLTEAIEADPDDTRALFQRSSVHYHNHAFQAAIDDMTRVIELAPNVEEAYINLGEMHLAMGNYKKALHYSEEARKRMNDEDPSLYVLANLAIALDALGKTDYAVKLWKRLLQMEPGFKNAAWTGYKLNWNPQITRLAERFIMAHFAEDEAPTAEG